jgi:drug/metabolite transporter (DMT)-like permease
MRILGILLVVFGVVLLAYGGLTLFIDKDVINLGDVASITIHENLVIPLPPIMGLICLVLGIVMLSSPPAYIPPPPPPRM